METDLRLILEYSSFKPTWCKRHKDYSAKTVLEVSQNLHVVETLIVHNLVLLNEANIILLNNYNRKTLFHVNIWAIWVFFTLLLLDPPPPNITRTFFLLFIYCIVKPHELDTHLHQRWTLEKIMKGSEITIGNLCSNDWWDMLSGIQRKSEADWL